MHSKSFRRPPEAQLSVERFRMTAEQLVPTGQKARHMPHFRHALPILHTVRRPKEKRSHAEKITTAAYRLDSAVFLRIRRNRHANCELKAIDHIYCYLQEFCFSRS
jgi:hypothetical protein